MLDIAGFLTSPRLYVGALIGLLAGLGVAHLLHSHFFPGVPTEVLAILAAVGIIIGLVIAAWLPRKTDD